MTKIKIFDHSRKELAVLLSECFYIIGEGNKFQKLTTFEIDTMVNGMLKYQGSMHIDDFKEAFNMYANQEIEVKLFGGPAPMMIGLLCKAYKIKKMGPKPEATKTPSIGRTDEEEWFYFMRFINFYGHIPEGSDWVKLWNYCLFKDWIGGEGINPITQFSYRRYTIAESEVKELINTHWPHLIHNNNLFIGANAGNLNMSGLGERIRKSLGL